ncbi:Tyrocidine synthase III [Burkholderia oklahomensis]|uniref:hybrid non-ribosomal peptide synthetase/type I polyketide synthase n=2 Tax=Burkholderia oklahomensis TaxID=342113 RepID=UPI000ABE2212|nr:hybrid non-ribosomal peptide synthetase/type I polyketide synthase [Burkholderia oklahomensis]SUY28414.1 Tyrocidine synthase III [Burkholderia oklahomensis]
MTNRSTRLQSLENVERTAAISEHGAFTLAPTAAQRRLWFVTNGDVRSATYNIAASFRIRGPLDEDALGSAFVFIANRHPILASRFRTVDGELVIEARPASALLQSADLSELAPDAQSAAVRRHERELAAHIFDLEREAPLRATLLRTGDDRHVLIVNIHHMASDAWSLDLFYRELGDAYRALRDGREPALAAVRYPTAADAAESPVDAESRDDGRKYWQRQLEGIPNLHKLPTDRPRPPQQRGAGAVSRHAFDPAIAAGIARLCRTAGVTPYTVGIAAFAALLHRYSSETDIVIGSPFANRATEEQQRQIGFFINLVPLRFDFSGAPSFLELLAQTQTTTLDAFEHIGLSFDEIVDVVQPPRSLSHAPVFQVMFDYLKGSSHALSLAGTDVDGALIHNGTTKYDLTLSLEEIDDEWIGFLEYDTDLYNASTIARLAGHLDQLLRSVLDAPNEPVTNGSLLSADELADVLRLAKPGEPLVSDGFSPIPRRIREAARRTPDAEAVVYRDTRLTYAELDRLSDRIAARLRARGVTPGSRVACFISYSHHIPVAFVAVLKAGGVYLPIGPNDPRFRDKIDDAQPRAIVTTEHDRARLDDDLGALALAVDDDAGEAPAAPPFEIPALLEDDPAYVIYTSGSTGKPKGVEVSHGNLNLSYHAWRQAYRFDQPGHPVALQLAGPTFDLCIGDLSRTLGSGGKLIMCPRDWLLDASKVHALIERERVTFGDFPPVVLRELIRYCHDRDVRLDGFAALVCGADVWFGHELQAAQALCAPHARVLGSYGVTEATIDSSVFDPAEHDLAPGSVVPIGRPLASCELYVADSRLQLTPIGVPGELLIAGPTVSQRYLNNPELTREKFISGAFDARGCLVQTPGETRFYRTGDVCRMLEDGTIEFLGRRDHQVKIRGFRVELGEIESTLAAHPDVRQCALTTKNEHVDDAMLVAYVVTDAPTAALYRFLRERLPAHMLPTAIERLPELPLTASGKIDRKRLQALEVSPLGGSQAEPRTDTERRVLELWRAALPAPVTGIDENFFFCGGHSLIAARLISRINDAFGVRFGVAALFKHPTVAEIAERVDDERRALADAGRAPDAPPGGADAPASESVSVRDSDPRRLSFAQNSLWFAAKRQPQDFTYNIPMVWRLDGAPDRDALACALDDIVRRHPALRTTFSANLLPLGAESGDVSLEPVQTVADGVQAALRIVNVADDETLSRLLRDEETAPFDLTTGPLVRAALFVRDDRRHLLCVTVHHIVFDGPSLGIFWRDLQAAYNARARGEAFVPAPPGATYADFVARQRAQANHPALDRQLSHWRERLRDLPPALRIPAGAVAQTQPGPSSFEIPAPLAARIERTSRQLSCTPLMFYLSLFAQALRDETGDDDLAIGIPTSLRPTDAFDSVIGFFTNTLPLRVRFDDAGTFRDLLDHVKHTCLDVFEHREVPFERLVQALNPPRPAKRNPIFQVLFSYDLDEVGSLDFEGVRATLHPLETYVAKLDLECAVARQGDAVFCHLMSRPGSFDDSSLERMRERFLALAARASADVDVRAGTVANGHATPATADGDRADLHALFAARVADSSERVAIESGDLVLTYRELDALSAATAASLRRVGVRSGDRVGICMGRHPYAVAAMLAIARVGAAFVPLDPEHKPQWNQYIADDAALRAIISRGELVDKVAHLSLPLVDIDIVDVDPPADAATLDAAVATDGAAYVIYTSGSTGMPKGVAVPHRSVCHNVLAMRDTLGVTHRSRIAQYSSPIFDAVLGEIFPALAAGAAVIFGERRRLLPGNDLVDWLAQRQITHLWIVPSALALVPHAPLPALEAIVVAGEACPREVARRWAAGRRLFNGYGPTECAIAVSMAEYWAEGERLVLRPLGGARFYVLDDSLEEARDGAAGELFVGGVCVSHGYLGKPARTASAFVADPFAAHPGARMYRTGDVVRRLDDGSVQFIGRADRQVKIRGFRIELDAVRAALMEAPGVRAAEALVHADARGQLELVGYVVGSGDRDALVDALRGKIPDVMIPSAYVFLDRLPTGRTGKVDLQALKAIKPTDGATRAIARTASDKPASARATPAATIARVAAIWRELLGRADIGGDENFFDAGGHSLRAVALHQRLSDAFGDWITLTDVFEYPTIHALSAQIDVLRRRHEQAAADPASPATEATAVEIDEHSIAVVGLVGRFPQAPDLQTFWERLLSGYEAGTELSDDELHARGVPPEVIAHPDFVRRAKVLERVADFDAEFFGYSPREAQVMDPQQRIFLELAWELLEQAGYGDRDAQRPVGVFGSVAFSYYLVENVIPNIRKHRLDAGQWMLGNDKDFVATRTAYKLDLRGPAVSVATACSSSLTAVHMACASLRTGECELAIAGAVGLDPEQGGYVYSEGGIMSPDGRCRPFDAAANGTAGGSGAGLVLLKKQSAAIRDGDTIHAVIKGSAINNDGGSKVSYTAPSVSGQAAVIVDALRAARVTADTIGYVEAHGTGTPLGDPIEVRALTQAFAASASADASTVAPPAGKCGIGSLKGNIGHLDAAAGIAGLIKTILALRHEVIPPSINCGEPNPQIRFDETPFEVVRTARPWARGAAPRRAGVSAFGVGGTNAHVIVEEAPAARAERPAADTGEGAQLLPVSAKSREAVSDLARSLSARLASGVEGATLRDVAHTLQVGRTAFAHRAFVVGEGVESVAAQLGRAAALPIIDARKSVPIVFMFPGQGSQYAGMGHALYRRYRVFRDAVDHCADLLAPHLHIDIRALIHGDGGRTADSEQLRETRYAQPALFTVEYALARLLDDWGIAPDALIGHSLGELVAACISRRLALDDALALVAARAAAMQRQPAGAMLAVTATPRDLDALYATGCELAAINGDDQFVLSGSPGDVAKLEDACVLAGLPCQRIATSHAFHSALMENAVGEINRIGASLRIDDGLVPMISNRSGRWFDESDRRDPGYWGDHVRRTVRFSEGLSTVLAAFDRPLLLEVGPGRTLASLAAGLGGFDRSRVATTMRHAREQRTDEAALLTGIGTLWAHGAHVEWERLRDGAAARRVALPTYPFRRKRHWLDRPAADASPDHAPPPPDDGTLRFAREEIDAKRIEVRFTLSERHWFVDEHRIFERNGVLPGTGCLELVRRAFVISHGASQPVLRDVYFPSPLVFEAGARRSMRVVFTQRDDALDFVLESRGDGVSAAETLPHASGSISAARLDDASPFPDDSVDALCARLALQPLADVPAQFGRAFAEYGPRWRCIDAVWLGERRGLARLRLPSSFERDLPAFALHPALLDLGVAFLHACLRPADASLPFRYETLTVHAPLTAECYSLAIERAPRTFDVTLFSWDAQARRATTLVEIRGFGLRETDRAGGAASRRAAEATPADWCRTPAWVQAPLPAHRREAGPWLTFVDAPDAPLAAHAPSHSAQVVKGDAFRRLDDARFALRAGSRDDYARLLDALASDGRLPSQIVYAWGAGEARPAHDAAHDGFAHLVTLIQTLAEHAAAPRVTLVTRRWRRADTPAACAAAAIAGSLKAVQWEFPDIVCRHVDVDDDEPSTQQALLAELAIVPDADEGGMGHVDKAPTVCLAAGRRETLRFVDPPVPASNGPLRDGGVYLITGGLGGIGGELARHIAETTAGAKLGLIGRQRDGLSDKQAARLRELEAAGADVAVLRADVADARQMQAAIAELHTRFGPVNGVIHSAGVEASGLIETGTPDAWRRVLAAKVAGTHNLHDVIATDRPDFVVLCSSLASLVGGLGQADYAAANGYLDAIARHWRRARIPVVSLNWDAWAETGMAVDYTERMMHRGADAVRGLTNREGRAIFDLAIGMPAAGVAQLAVSKFGFDHRPADAKRKTAAAPPSNDVERTLVGLWRDLLGVDDVGIDDDFFDLGGHSLLATQLISQVRDLYGRCLTLGEFLDAPTISRILRSIDATGRAQPSNDAAIRYCVVPMVDAGRRAPFFCIPGMGGNITQLLPLATTLHADRPVVGLQYLGLDGTAAPHTSIEQIAAHYIACMRSVQPQGPYHFGGHSLGGKIAYEIARQLIDAGERVGLVVLFDSAAPPYAPVPYQDDAEMARLILGVFAYYAGKPELVDGVDEALRPLSRTELLDFIGERLARSGVVQAQSDSNSIRGLFNVYRAAADLSPTYDPPRVQRPIPMLLVKATDPMPEGFNLPEIRDTAAWGWEQFTSLPVECREVPGNHYSCLMPEYVGHVSGCVRAALASADATRPANPAVA